MAKTITPRTNVVRSFHSGQALPSSAIKLDSIPTTIERSERILLVEDEAETNLILKEYLQSLGYSVIAAANGVEGLKEVMKSDFELVICDMMMPRLPGDMFYLAVQKTRPHLCNRFVFITGHQESPQIDAFIARTHAAILVKPFRLHQLEMTLESVLSRFPRKVQAVTPTPLKIIPNDRDVRMNDQIVIQKHRQSFEEIPVKKEAIPSMVVKALKIVGFMRNNDKVVPPPLDSIPSPVPIHSQPAKITERIVDLPKTTRRIPELADKPIVHSKEKNAADEVSGQRVTRRIEAAEDLVVRLPKPASTASSSSAEKNVTVRVKNRESSDRQPDHPGRVTRKIPTAAPVSSPKSIPPTGKTTTRIPKTTAKIATPVKSPKTAAQATRKVAPSVARKKVPAATPGKKPAPKK